MSGGDGQGGLRGAGSRVPAGQGARGRYRRWERSGCGTSSSRKERRGRTRFPSAVSGAGRARRAALSAGRWWPKPAPPRRQSRGSSAAERGARRGGGGKRRRRVAGATGGAAAARTGADPVCSGTGLEAELGQWELHRRRSHVPVDLCPLCPEQQFPSPTLCLGRTHWFSRSPLPWSRGIGSCCPPGKERSGRWRASTLQHNNLPEKQSGQ